MNKFNFNTNGIYGIYCKDSKIYSKTIEFKQGLIGSILAEDNSAVVLYNSKISGANYIEANRNSNVFSKDLNLSGQYNFARYKSDNNSFINFPCPIYDAQHVLENSTGFNTNNKVISDLSGNATSLLYNNGFEYYLTKLKNGIFLSDIVIETSDYSILKNYLDNLPRNLNGFNLKVTIQDSQTSNNTPEITLSYFYGGIITITSTNNNSINIHIENCENVILDTCKNVNFTIKNVPDLHLSEETTFTNVFFDVSNSNVFGENITFKLDKVPTKLYIFSLFNSKCFLNSYTKLNRYTNR